MSNLMGEKFAEEISYLYICKNCGHKFIRKQPMGTVDLEICSKPGKG